MIFHSKSADISDLFIESFGRNESCQKWYFEKHYIAMIKFLICTVLPPGSSRVDQTDKFDDFLNLVQLFETPYTVLIEIKNCRKLRDKQR